MQRKTKLLIAGTSAVGLVALALGGFAVAHSRHEGMGYGMMDGHGRGHGMMGMAEKFADRYDTNKDGKVVKNNVIDTTEINNGDAAAKFEDIKVGDTVNGLRIKKNEAGTEYDVVKITKIGVVTNPTTP